MYLHNLIDLYLMQRNQWKNFSKIRKIQDSKLKKLIHHAYENVSYYRRLFDSTGIKPEDIKGVNDLWKIPTTTKKQLKSLPRRDIVAQGININKCRPAVTSGSTGVPLKMYFTRDDFTLKNLVLIRSFLSHGIRPWHRGLEFTGGRYVSRRKSWYEWMGIFRKLCLSAYQDPDEWIEAIRFWKPHFILGYVLSLKLLARRIEKKAINDIKPNVIFSTSGVLDNATRNLLKSAFQAKVVDLYGAWESGFIAWECDRCPGYHINSDMVIVEFLKNGKRVNPGEEGGVVITNLHTFAMPFIRYELGDIGVPSGDKPVCGRSFPLIKVIKGRVADYIKLPSGRVISPHPFYRVMEETPGLKEWRIVQISASELVVEIVGEAVFAGAAADSILSRLKELVDDEVAIKITVVDRIERGLEEKRRSVVSRLKITL